MRRLALLLVPLTILAAGQALARRPAVAPGQTPPPEPTPSPARPVAPPPTRAEPEPDQEQPRAVRPKARPAAEGETKPQPPSAPAQVKPVDELGELRPAAATLKPPSPTEAVYQKRALRRLYTLHVNPAQPKPGATFTAVFEVTELLEEEDATYGDRKPLANADLALAVLPSGKGERLSYRLHPLADAGSYGTHLTLPASGLMTLRLTQRDPVKSGESPVAVDFELGVGVPSPSPAAAGEERSSGGRAASRRPMRASASTEGPDPDAVMQRLGERWQELEEMLTESATLKKGKRDPKAEAVARELSARASAIAELAAQLKGGVPAVKAREREEYDQWADRLADAARELPQLAKDRAKLREAMAHIQANQCLKCHVKYQYDLTDDLSEWPRFTVRPPRGRGAKP